MNATPFVIDKYEDQFILNRIFRHSVELIIQIPEYRNLKGASTSPGKPEEAKKDELSRQIRKGTRRWKL